MMAIEQSNTTATVSAGEVARDVLRSWSQEWVSLYKKLATYAVTEAPLPHVTFTADQILVRPAGSCDEIAIPAGDDAEAGTPIAALKLHASGKANVELAFSEADVLRPTIRLPRTRRSVFDKALYFELARISPIEVDALYFDYHLESAHADGSDVLARLRVIRRMLVDRAIASCHGAGLNVAHIRLGSDGRLADWRVFPVDRSALLFQNWEKFKLVVLATLAALLFCLLVFAAYSRGEARLSGIASRIAEARSEAAETGRLRDQWDHLIQAQSFLEAQRHKPPIDRTLAQLSRGLPDDTWMTGLQVIGKKMRLQGYSRSASHLVSEIGDMGFHNPQFEAPVTRDGVTKAERFDLSFELNR